MSSTPNTAHTPTNQAEQSNPQQSHELALQILSRLPPGAYTDQQKQGIYQYFFFLHMKPEKRAEATRFAQAAILNPNQIYQVLNTMEEFRNQYQRNQQVQQQMLNQNQNPHLQQQILQFQQARQAQMTNMQNIQNTSPSPSTFSNSSANNLRETTPRGGFYSNDATTPQSNLNDRSATPQPPDSWQPFQQGGSRSHHTSPNVGQDQTNSTQYAQMMNLLRQNQQPQNQQPQNQQFQRSGTSPNPNPNQNVDNSDGKHISSRTSVASNGSNVSGQSNQSSAIGRMGTTQSGTPNTSSGANQQDIQNHFQQAFQQQLQIQRMTNQLTQIQHQLSNPQYSNPMAQQFLIQQYQQISQFLHNLQSNRSRNISTPQQSYFEHTPQNIGPQESRLNPENVALMQMQQQMLLSQGLNNNGIPNSQSDQISKKPSNPPSSTSTSDKEQQEMTNRTSNYSANQSMVSNGESLNSESWDNFRSINPDYTTQFRNLLDAERRLSAFQKHLYKCTQSENWKGTVDELSRKLIRRKDEVESIVSKKLSLSKKFFHPFLSDEETLILDRLQLLNDQKEQSPPQIVTHGEEQVLNHIEENQGSCFYNFEGGDDLFSTPLTESNDPDSFLMM